MKRVLILFLLAFTIVFAQQKQRLAILPSVGDELDAQRLDLLTDKVREIASNTLPTNNFILLKKDAVMEMIGQGDYFSACQEGTCIGELAKKANANYGARCDILKIDNKLVLKFELYSVKDEAILATFTEYDNATDFREMLAVLEERLPNAFRKMLPNVLGTVPLPTVQGGIGNVETATSGMLGYGEQRYVVNLNTEPQGANLSFNGVPLGSCSKTPCKVELSKGSFRIIAALEQYETADTTISVKQNNQSINIKLKPNFGVLEIKPAYSDGIGNNRQWDLIINKKSYSSFENRLLPGNYEVKLSHECYEDISFKAGINKGSSEVFNVSRHLNLKQGSLDLSAEKDGEPVSESVFVNGKYEGETPFNGAVPICTEISIGNNKEKVDVKIVHNQRVSYKHNILSKISTSGPIFKDSRDGKKYKTVKIGTQTWMAENLNYNVSGSKCYDNKTDNCDKYGRLYNWKTAMKACPNGWHLPTNKKWELLEKAIGGKNTAGKRLKAMSGWDKKNANSGWNSNGNGMDYYGFAALPGGHGSSAGSFSNSGNNGNWWSANDQDASKAYIWNMSSRNDHLGNNPSNKSNLFSVRCLQDN